MPQENWSMSFKALKSSASSALYSPVYWLNGDSSNIQEKTYTWEGDHQICEGTKFSNPEMYKYSWSYGDKNNELNIPNSVQTKFYIKF